MNRRAAFLALTAGLLIVAPARAEEWSKVWSAPSQVAQALAASPSARKTLYLVAADVFSGQLTTYRSDDGGDTWKAFPVNNIGLISVAGLAVDPSNPSMVYAATSAGAFKTTDGSEHWTGINILGGAPSLDAIVVDPNSPSTLYAVNDWSVFKSKDEGATWFYTSGDVNTGDNSVGFIYSIAIDPLNSSVLYLGTTTSVFKSVTAGTRWFRTGALTTGNAAAFMVNALAVDPTSSTSVYAVTGYQNSGGPICFFDSPLCDIGVGAFRTVDGGVNWSSLAVGSVSPLISVAIDPITPSVLWAGSNDGLWESRDGGATWRTVNDGLSGFGVRSLPHPLAVATGDATVLYAATSDGLFARAIGADGSPSCKNDQSHVCVQGRFAISVGWQSAYGGGGQGTAVALTSNTGAFWFFDSSNLELVVKVLDGRSVDGHFWVFYGSLTNVEFTLTVTDTVTGTVRTYFNPQGNLASFADTSAF